jgi:hypothetical protein
MTEWIKSALTLASLPPRQVQRLRDYLDQPPATGDDDALEKAWIVRSPNFTFLALGECEAFSRKFENSSTSARHRGIPSQEANDPIT